MKKIIQNKNTKGSVVYDNEKCFVFQKGIKCCMGNDCDVDESYDCAKCNDPQFNLPEDTLNNPAFDKIFNKCSKN